MQWLWVGLGGGLGAMGRYAIARLLPVADGFPWATLAANLLGCFLLGVLFTSPWVERSLSGPIRLGMTTGFCGGFTTYSTFNLEVIRMCERQQVGQAVAYVATTVLVGGALGMLGFWIGRTTQVSPA